MTPFAEDILEMAPGMDEFFGHANFHDFNARSDEVYKIIEGDPPKEAESIRPAEGAYWIECSGFDRRYRLGFAVEVEGPEAVAKVFEQRPGGEITAADGIGWILFSKYRPAYSAIAVDDKLTLHPICSAILAACFALLARERVQA